MTGPKVGVWEPLFGRSPKSDPHGAKGLGGASKDPEVAL